MNSGINNKIFRAGLDGYDVIPLVLFPSSTRPVAITVDNHESVGHLLVTHKGIVRQILSFDLNGGISEVVVSFEDVLVGVGVDDEYIYWYGGMLQGLYRAHKHRGSEPQLLVKDVGVVADFRIAKNHGRDRE